MTRTTRTMTVKEMMETLSKFDGDMLVHLSSDSQAWLEVLSEEELDNLEDGFLLLED